MNHVSTFDLQALRQSQQTMTKMSMTKTSSSLVIVTMDSSALNASNPTSFFDLKLDTPDS